ncbi:ABC transporter substrate-binding protein [Leptobacterium flavescens]|uniref:ABC transporter substrate-binding protein n=1 Tax=Leptobacterium flavescens TaxID=472055 RepID=A0A6P0URD5_9FLAO|nr:substrate-binding domain-containing protein [Leptobacterium flavescens]NER13423.1 ABC transporter substrate-binding protein [Leptobacterium flavescens]
MKTVKIAGVPEHFNLPWHLAIEEAAFESRGIQLEWTDVPEGTGRMCNMLREGETDIAIILTEGITRDIIAGNPSKIVQVYVKSPLVWGIHVGAASPYQRLEDVEGRKAAISRFGSGSHLMAYVNADKQNWDIEKLQFEVINNLDGAVEALSQGTADYFMWERFTTKPLVDEGVFRRIADCPTPWPCFVIAVREEFIRKEKGSLKHILEIINTYTSEFKYIPSIDRSLANRYNQKLEDIKEWLAMTHWSQENLSTSTISMVQQYLSQLNLIEKTVNFEAIVTEL